MFNSMIPYDMFNSLMLYSDAGSRWASHRQECDENGTTISIDVPGLKTEEIKITAEDGKVMVVGTSKAAHRNVRKEFICTRHADMGKIEAIHEDGILKLVIPRKPSDGREIVIRRV